MTFALILTLIVLVLFFFMGINIYNNLVALKNQMERAWTNIDIILKQRFDEIPQLIQVIEQYAQYEQQSFKKIVEARNAYMEAKNIDGKMKAANDLSSGLQGLLALGEAYPELKANASFVQLQSRVSELENQIADRRELFNESVTNFNTRIEQLPDVFFARALGYTEKPLYRPPVEQTTRPSLKMNLG